MDPTSSPPLDNNEEDSRCLQIAVQAVDPTSEQPLLENDSKLRPQTVSHRKPAIDPTSFPPLEICSQRLPTFESSQSTRAYPCVCNNDWCKELSSRFRQLRDIRGFYVQVPSAADESSTRKKGLAVIKAMKLQRIKVHLQLVGIQEDQIRSIDNRNRRSKSTRGPDDMNVRVTRSSKPIPTQVRRKIAWHHFHPIVIKERALQTDRNGKSCYAYLDKIPADFVRQHQLTGEGYSEADKCDQHHYLFVPSYRRERAQEDEKKLREHTRLMDKAQEIIGRRRGASIQRNSLENDQQPRKRCKFASADPTQQSDLDNEIGDLEAIICMLHERLQPLLARAPNR